MDKLQLNQYKSSFDSIAHYIENEQKEQVEIWFARELQAVLGYARWENFVVAINRAVESCKTQSINVDDHFREVTKMIEIGKGGKLPSSSLSNCSALYSPFLRSKPSRLNCGL